MNASSAQIQPSYLEDADWQNILWSISEKKCVIVLGPGAAINNHGTKLHETLCIEIANKLNQESYERHDSLFSLSEQLLKIKQGESELSILMNRIYGKAQPSEFHNQLSKIPVSLYISTTPDLMLKNSMELQKFEYNFSYFDRKKTIPVEETPTPKRPLIYNLFGCINDQHSCVLTHDHLFDFLFSIIGTKPIPEIILNSIKEANNFIFLGFDFESWYLKLMLRKFGLHEKGTPSYAFSLPDLMPGTIHFLSNKFKLVFIKNNSFEIQNFVNELFTRCEQEAEKQDKFKIQMRQEANAPIIPFKETLLNLISENLIDELFSKLENHCKSMPEKYKTLLLMRYQYMGWNADKLRGIESKDILSQELQKIMGKLIDFITDL